MKTDDTANLVIETPSDAIKIIRLARPRERNPLSVEVLHELEQIFAEFEKAEKIRALIFTGTDDVFASGANLREIAALETDAEVRAFGKRGQNFMCRIAESRLLTIAAVNGFCMGGAFDLALSCAVRFASPNAVFAHTGANLGIMTAWSGTQVLPRIVGEAKALEIFLTARRISADEALQIGLLNAVATDVLTKATDFARETVTGERL